MANVVALTDTQLRVSGLLAAGAVVALIVAPYVGWLTWCADRRVQTGVAGGLAFLGTLWWRPCVGEELGVILTGAANDGLAGELLGMAAYMAGATSVVMVERTDYLLGTGLVGGIMRNNGRYTAAEEMRALGAGDRLRAKLRMPGPDVDGACPGSSVA